MLAIPRDDLDFDFATAAPWFPHEKEDPYVLVRVSDAHANAWSSALGLTVRRCYVSDALVAAQAVKLGVAEAAVIAAALPDAGSTMSGDFGEILVYLYQAAQEAGNQPFGPKKWRIKQDRTKPAPYSDVVHFVLPSWPTPTDKDQLLCSEVKAKATEGDFKPIKLAIEHSAKDRTSRLASTLVWLRDRILTGAPIGDIQIAHLDRFINSPDHAPYKKRFRAVAVVCESLVNEELAHAPATAPTDYTLVVIAVPDLKGTYTAVMDAARAATPPPVEPVGGST